MSKVKSDIEIARAAKMKPIQEILDGINVPDKAEFYSPSINKKFNDEELNKLYEDRKIVYSTADLKIDCNLKNKNEIVEDIRKIYENS